MVGPSYFQLFPVTNWIAATWLVDGCENTCCTTTSMQQKTIQYKQKPEPDGWVVVSTSFRNMSVVNLNRREMARKWLGDGQVVASSYFQRLRV